MFSHLKSRSRATLLLVGLVAACADQAVSPAEPESASLRSGRPDDTRPPLRVALSTPDGPVTVFPYVNEDLGPAGLDPVSLVFSGHADPRQVRAALLALDGNRAGPLAAFDCVWTDAVGGLQTGWSAISGWVGSAIQLACGEYGPLRFHLRFFDVGRVTLGTAHLEFLIPGTTDHQVVSWELAEQLVAYDMARTGLLGAAPGTTGMVNDAPWFRTLPGFLYTLASQSDPHFAALLGGLGLVDLPNGDKGIPTDGAATTLHLARRAVVVPGSVSQDFEVPFGQVIPKPFCVDGAPSPYLHVSGPVRLRLTSVQRPDGEFVRQMSARGRLTVTPWNPATNQAAGPSYTAEVSETQHTSVDARGASIQGTQHQVELPMGRSGHGQLQIRIKVGTTGAPRYAREVRCGRP